MEKVLVLSLSILSSKSSRIIKEATTLVENGYDVIVTGIKYNDQLDNEIIQGLHFHRYSLKSKKLPSFFFFQIFKLLEFYKCLKKENKYYDIIDCHCLFSLLIGTCLRRKIHPKKIILNAHELETERNGLRGFRKIISKILERLLIKKCDNVIVVSNSIEKWYKQNYPKADITCIYNTPKLVSPIKRDYFRNKFSIPTDSIVFLYQGGFSQGRGIDLLIETFRELPEKYQIVFMGYGFLEETIKEAQKYYKNIHIHEAVPQVELNLYTPSANYGFSLIEKQSLSYDFCMPNKLFEYIMFEVPVIVSNTIDQSDFVTTNEIGYVLQNYTVTDLKELILSLDNSKYYFFQNNMKKIKTNICWESQEERLLKIYR